MKYMGSDSQHQEDILPEHLRGEVSCFIEDCSSVTVDALEVESHILSDPLVPSNLTWKWVKPSGVLFRWVCRGDPTHWKRPWCWERLKAGGERGNGEWDGITDSMDTSLRKLKDIGKDKKGWHAAVHEAAKELDTTEQLNSISIWGRESESL